MVVRKPKFLVKCIINDNFLVIITQKNSQEYNVCSDTNSWAGIAYTCESTQLLLHFSFLLSYHWVLGGLSTYPKNIRTLKN